MKIKKFASEYTKRMTGVQSPQTLKSYNLALRLFYDFIGKNIDIGKITIRQGDDFKSFCSRRKLAPASTNNYLRSLKTTLGRAKEWGHIRKNPLSKLKLLREVKRPHNFLPVDEIGPFLKGIKSENFRLMLTAYCATGRRRGELFRMTWDEIDMENKIYRAKSHKTGSHKDLPMGEMFYGALVRLKGRGNGAGRVFPFLKNIDSITHKAKTEFRRAGYPDLRLHDLRHTFATMYLQLGGDMRPLMDFLLHQNINTTLRYSHVTQGHLQEEMKKVKFDIAA